MLDESRDYINELYDTYTKAQKSRSSPSRSLGKESHLSVEKGSLESQKSEDPQGFSSQTVGPGGLDSSNRFKCAHGGCGKFYTDPEEECHYHPGEIVPNPIVMVNTWDCCNAPQATHENITPCTTGKHAIADEIHQQREEKRYGKLVAEDSDSDATSESEIRLPSTGNKSDPLSSRKLVDQKPYGLGVYPGENDRLSVWLKVLESTDILPTNAQSLDAAIEYKDKLRELARERLGEEEIRNIVDAAKQSAEFTKRQLGFEELYQALDEYKSGKSTGAKALETLPRTLEEPSLGPEIRKILEEAIQMAIRDGIPLKQNWAAFRAYLLNCLPHPFTPSMLEDERGLIYDFYYQHYPQKEQNRTPQAKIIEPDASQSMPSPSRPILHRPTSGKLSENRGRSPPSLPLAPTALKQQVTQLLSELTSCLELCTTIVSTRRLGNTQTSFDALYSSLPMTIQAITTQSLTLRKILGSQMDLGDETSRNVLSRAIRDLQTDIKARLQNIAHPPRRDRTSSGPQALGFRDILQKISGVEWEVCEALDSLSSRLQAEKLKAVQSRDGDETADKRPGSSSTKPDMPHDLARPPRLPLPIEEEVHIPSSPINEVVTPGLDIDPRIEAWPLRSSMASNTATDEGDGEELLVDEPTPTVPTTFEWLDGKGGEKVFVTGTMFEWSRKTRLHPVEGKPGVFRSTIRAQPGTHHIRFIVDGVMQCSKNLPTTVDFDNNLVNYIEVSGTSSTEIRPEGTNTLSPESRTGKLTEDSLAIQSRDSSTTQRRTSNQEQIRSNTVDTLPENERYSLWLNLLREAEFSQTLGLSFRSKRNKAQELANEELSDSKIRELMQQAKEDAWFSEQPLTYEQLDQALEGHRFDLWSAMDWPIQDDASKGTHMPHEDPQISPEAIGEKRDEEARSKESSNPYRELP